MDPIPLPTSTGHINNPSDMEYIYHSNDMESATRGAAAAETRGSMDRRKRRSDTMTTTTALRVGLAAAALYVASAVPLPGADAAAAGFIASHPRRRSGPPSLRAGAFHPACASSPLATVATRSPLSGRQRTTGASRPIRPGGGTTSSTRLNVWWFGGNSDAEAECDDDTCELVAVRIESPSPNSRRIRGEITVDAPLEDVWAVLTDYDNLSTHVPNLVESKKVPMPGGGSAGEQGDGRYRCRLYQKGAQKIVGFEFGASVTMDMAENIVVASRQHHGDHGSDPHYDAALAGTNIVMERVGNKDPNLFPPERTISFKCVESPFFSAFDGEWGVTETVDGSTGMPVSTVRYVVDVKPRGPVPVMALEWRIREDVPTNLRAVKRAAVEVGYAGVMAARNGVRYQLPQATSFQQQRQPGLGQQQLQPAVAAVGGSGVVRFDGADADWDEDETMAVYLNNNNDQ